MTILFFHWRDDLFEKMLNVQSRELSDPFSMPNDWVVSDPGTSGTHSELQTPNYLRDMAEDLQIISGSKTEQYESLLPQVKGLLEGEPDLVANLANVVAALKEQFGWLWIGFYLVKKSDNKDEELVLGPFQGPVACTRIRKGKGVCGSSWAEAKTLIVPDVEKFPGHIACSSLSKSEIVVPVIRHGQVVAVLDADSSDYNQFNTTDQQYLEIIIDLIPF